MDDGKIAHITPASNMHTCMKCGQVYTSEEMVTLRSCVICGGTTFLFKAKSVRRGDVAVNEKTVASDVKVLDNGIFELNIASMAQHEPVVIEGDEGVFFIKFPKKK